MQIDRIKLIVAMAEQKIGVCALADKAGVTRVTVSAVKAGKPCAERTAVRLAAGLDVPLSTLLQN